MKIRRIVTGHDQSGKSVFLSDGEAPRAHSFASIPGHAMAQLWTTPPRPVPVSLQSDPTFNSPSLLPQLGGTSIAIFDFPPDSVMANPLDGQSAATELGQHLPGLFDTFDSSNPGMHTTPTIDYGILLEGELWLELDDGESRRVLPGDVVVQQATRHAWRNKSDKIARALFVMIGCHEA